MKIERGTIAVVTGAGSGIGRALTVKLAQTCSRLAIADINQDELRETAALATNPRDCRISTHHVDVSDREQVAQFAQDVLATHGGANLLINNAGVALAGATHEVSIEDIEWLMGVNFWGVVYGVKHFLPILLQQSCAHIVNISSVFGMIGPPGQAAYAASKFAVRGFTEALRHEHAGSNLRVSAVHPGGIKTNIARRARVGAGASSSAYEDDRNTFERVARTTPEKAAETILRGVELDQERILIGPDAWLIDRLQRWMPVRYWKVMGALLEKSVETR